MSHKIILRHLLTGRPVMVYPKRDEEGILVRIQGNKLVSFTYDPESKQWSKHLKLGPLEFLSTPYLGYNLNVTESGVMPSHCDEVYESKLAVSDLQFVRDILSNDVLKITITSGTYYIGLNKDGIFFVETAEERRIKEEEEAREKENNKFKDFVDSKSHSANYLDEHELLQLLEPQQAIAVGYDGTIHAYQFTDSKLESFLLVDTVWYRKNSHTVMELLNLKVSKYLLIPRITNYIDDTVSESNNGLNVTDREIIEIFIEHGHVIYQSKEKLNIFKLSQRGNLLYNNWLDYTSDFSTSVCTKNALQAKTKFQQFKLDLLWDCGIDITKVKEDQLPIRLMHVFKYIDQPIFRFILCSLYGLLDHEIKTLSEIAKYLGIEEQNVLDTLDIGIAELKKSRRVYTLRHGIPEIDISIIEISDIPSHLILSDSDIIRTYREKIVRQEEIS